MRLTAKIGVVLCIFLFVYSLCNCNSGNTVDELRLKAVKGDVDAQRDLGDMYLKGQGVPQNYAEAEKWYKEAVMVHKKRTQN